MVVKVICLYIWICISIHVCSVNCVYEVGPSIYYIPTYSGETFALFMNTP